MQGLQSASHDPALLARLHVFNDWVQMTLIKVSGEIGTAFFPSPMSAPSSEPSATETNNREKPTPAATQNQSQNQKQS